MDNPQIDKYGDKWWYDEEKKLHRSGGPAVIYSSGSKFWFQHGMAHRNNGPALIWNFGKIAWAWNDVEFALLEDYLQVADLPEQQKTLLRLQYT